MRTRDARPATPLAAPAAGGRRPVLVTGGAGFIGSNLADRLAAEGHDVLVYDALVRDGVEENLAWLRRRHPARIAAAIADVRDADALADAVGGAAAVFHLAAQVAVTTSLGDPVHDFAVNAGGTLAVLESARRSPVRPPVVFASTNKVYGSLDDVSLALRDGAWAPEDTALARTGVGEGRALDYRTPYGCSKGAADAMVLDWGRSFGLDTAVLRMSCVYGPRQMGTEDQGWVAHFALRALAGEPVTLYGDGRQVRDVLDVGDAVAAYLAAWRRIGAIRGRAFNLGGGPANAVSLGEVLAELGRIVGRPVPTRAAPWREGDQRWYVSDVRGAAAALGLSAPKPWREGLAGLVAWLRESGRAAAPVLHTGTEVAS